MLVQDDGGGDECDKRGKIDVIVCPDTPQYFHGFIPCDEADKGGDDTQE